MRSAPLDHSSRSIGKPTSKPKVESSFKHPFSGLFVLWNLHLLSKKIIIIIIENSKGNRQLHQPQPKHIHPKQNGCYSLVSYTSDQPTGESWVYQIAPALLRPLRVSEQIPLHTPTRKWDQVGQAGGIGKKGEKPIAQIRFVSLQSPAWQVRNASGSMSERTDWNSGTCWSFSPWGAWTVSLRDTSALLLTTQTTWVA